MTNSKETNVTRQTSRQSHQPAGVIPEQSPISQYSRQQNYRSDHLRIVYVLPRRELNRAYMKQLCINRVLWYRLTRVLEGSYFDPEGIERDLERLALPLDEVRLVQKVS